MPLLVQIAGIRVRCRGSQRPRKCHFFYPTLNQGLQVGFRGSGHCRLVFEPALKANIEMSRYRWFQHGVRSQGRFVSQAGIRVYYTVTAGAVIFQLKASPASDLCIPAVRRAAAGDAGRDPKVIGSLANSGLCSFTPLGTSCGFPPEKCTHCIADQLTLSASAWRD